MSVRNLQEIRKWSVPGIPDLGVRLSEALRDLSHQDNILSQQTGAQLNGNPSAPPALQGMSVVSHENGFDVAIQHEGDLYRGVHYFVDYADNPAFAGARTWHMGETRNAILPLGNRTLYFQAWAKYPWSASTSPVAHGASTPKPVTGGRYNALQPTQGCGTSRPNQQSHQQPPYRGNVPPTRTA